MEFNWRICECFDCIMAVSVAKGRFNRLMANLVCGVHRMIPSTAVWVCSRDCQKYLTLNPVPLTRERALFPDPACHEPHDYSG